MIQTDSYTSSFSRECEQMSSDMHIFNRKVDPSLFRMVFEVKAPDRAILFPSVDIGSYFLDRV
jgi:hypothetical protein